jgi:hypothetical protein
MKLSDTQRIVLSHGAQQPQLLAIAPKHLPVAACRAVVNSLIKSRLLIEVAAPRDQLAMVSAFRHSAATGRCIGHAGHYHCLECEEANTGPNERHDIQLQKCVTFASPAT